jgi:hypothetical protein
MAYLTAGSIIGYVMFDLTRAARGIQAGLAALDSANRVSREAATASGLVVRFTGP